MGTKEEPTETEMDGVDPDEALADSVHPREVIVDLTVDLVGGDGALDPAIRLGEGMR